MTAPNPSLTSSRTTYVPGAPKIAVDAVAVLRARLAVQRAAPSHARRLGVGRERARVAARAAVVHVGERVRLRAHHGHERDGPAPDEVDRRIDIVRARDARRVEDR